MTSVLISGLTAAGKTTHSLLLADALGYECLHFTQLLLEQLDICSEDENQVWFERMREIEALRGDGRIEGAIDRQLADAVSRNDRLVVDSILAPWLAADAPICVWIGSDRLSRAWKCQFSASMVAGVDTPAAAALIDEKDALTRKRFRSARGVDIYTDRKPFDFVLDNSHLISAPTEAAVQSGIAVFHKILRACVVSVENDDPSILLDLLESASPAECACVLAVSPRVSRLFPRLDTVLGLGIVPSRQL